VLVVHAFEDLEVDWLADEPRFRSFQVFGKSGRNGATCSENRPPSIERESFCDFRCSLAEEERECTNEQDDDKDEKERTEGSQVDEGKHVQEVYTIKGGRFWSWGWEPLASARMSPLANFGASFPRSVKMGNVGCVS
jgi:hypothetical protein